jgi:hypothetical protein
MLPIVSFGILTNISSVAISGSEAAKWRTVWRVGGLARPSGSRCKRTLVISFRRRTAAMASGVRQSQLSELYVPVV